MDIRKVLKIIDDAVNKLNLKKNYSLKGEKKVCCQVELVRLKHKLIKTNGLTIQYKRL